MASISQAQASKEEMEREILQAVIKFEKATKLVVSFINLDCHHVVINRAGRDLKIETTVEL